MLRKGGVAEGARIWGGDCGSEVPRSILWPAAPENVDLAGNKDVKKIANFSFAVIWKIGAMNSVFDAVNTELGANGLRPDFRSKIDVPWSSGLSEFVDCVRSLQLEGTTWSRAELFDGGLEFWDDAFIDLKELGCGWNV